MLFFSDLDNTIIFSRKRMSDTDFCVEKKGEKNLSYMTMEGAEKFRNITSKCTFIPVTTRSLEQYERISFPFGISPEYAVCDNGGSILLDGVKDEEFSKESFSRFLEAFEEISKCRKFLENCEMVYMDIRIVDECFLFTKCHEPEKTLAEIQKKIPSEKTFRYTIGDKIYIIPRGISKIHAVETLKKRLGGFSVSAGDSLFDIPMLENTDIAIVKNGIISDKTVNQFQITEITGNKPDFVLDMVDKIITINDIKNWA